MEIDDKLKKINNELKVYLASLLRNESILIDNISAANSLSVVFLRAARRNVDFNISYSDFYKKLQKSLIKETLENTLQLVRDYFSETYDGIYDEKIKKMMSDGTLLMLFGDKEFNSFISKEYESEISELKIAVKELEASLKLLPSFEERAGEKREFIIKEIQEKEYKIEDSEFLLNHLYETSFFYNDEKCGVNILLSGTIMDGLGLIHEIRHFLNIPQSKLEFVRNISTEGLSLFEELNYIKYLEIKYNGLNFTALNEEVIRRAFFSSEEFNREAFLIAIYNKYGSISLENYKDFTAEEDSTDFEKKILRGGLKKEISFNKKYVFGIILALYLNNRLRSEPEFIYKIIELNSDLQKESEVEDMYEFIDFFKKIGFDLNDEEAIEKFINSELEYIMSRDNIQGVKM